MLHWCGVVLNGVAGYGTCGVMWSGAVLYCIVWCDSVWCGVVWCVLYCIVCCVVWCGAVWYGAVLCGVVWCGVVWCSVLCCGMIWYVCVGGELTASILHGLYEILRLEVTKLTETLLRTDNQKLDTLLNWFCEVSVSLLPKLSKKGKLQANLTQDDKTIICKQNITNQSEP